MWERFAFDRRRKLDIEAMGGIFTVRLLSPPSLPNHSQTNIEPEGAAANSQTIDAFGGRGQKGTANG